MSITPLHRHQLAWLTPAGWARVRSRQWDAVASACLRHWAGHGLPLVVTRQPGPIAGIDVIAMGLPAPGRWERRRIALSIPRDDVLCLDEFPRAEQVVTLLPEAARADWRTLCSRMAACGAVARVHGSYGWRSLSGLDYIRPSSDIDVWIGVSDVEQADAVTRQLQAFDGPHPRLDGELVFDGGNAVAWREWLCWRTGRANALLVKHLEGSSLWRQANRRDAVPLAGAAL
jgi:phosphoribosyl-dephospho-CoA transferase